MTEQLDITKLTIGELKALAWDERIKLDIAQTNLRTLASEIDKKEKESQTPEVI